MTYRLLAELVVALHLGFILFAVFGGLLALGRRRWAALHLPAMAWAALIEFAGWGCPLTPLENWLRRAAGEAAYEGDFLERYLVPLIYPPGLTRSHQVALGIALLAFNLVVYSVLWRRRPRND